MLYKIIRWKFTKNVEENVSKFIESEFERKVRENSYISLVSDKIYNHMTADETFDNFIDASIRYENILKELNVISWKEYQQQEYQKSVDNAINEIELFQKSFDNLVIIKKEQPIIYFLLKDKKIVYIGQSYSLKTKRPWQHTDKDWDDLIIYPVSDHSQLNNLETYLIYKLNPKYNDHPGPMKQNMLKTIVYGLQNKNI
jgi:hypothetical protein